MEIGVEIELARRIFKAPSSVEEARNRVDQLIQEAFEIDFGIWEEKKGHRPDDLPYIRNLKVAETVFLRKWIKQPK